MFSSNTVMLLLFSLSSSSAKLGGGTKERNLQTSQEECYTNAQRNGFNYGISYFAADPSYRLGQCSGDCDDDSDCSPGLICYQRDAYDGIPGCVGGVSDSSNTDFCIRPSDILEVKFCGSDPSWQLDHCQGDCDDDSDCLGDLVCFQRGTNEDVPGCTGGRNDRSRTDFCVKPEDLDEGDIEIKIVGTEQNALLGRCEGDCDVDEDCEGDMVCFQRDDCMYVPGCTGGYDDYSYTDYCVRKRDVSAGKLALEESNYFPLGLCQGDCDYNWDCEPGLICQQRGTNEEVIGCIGGGSDSSRTDYCVSPNNRGNTRKAAIESSLGEELNPYNEEALEWLINTDQWVPPTDEEKPQELWRERYAMTALYFSTDGDKWLDPRKYLSPESVCEWSGFGYDIEVWCNANNRVLGVTGRDNGMLGSIPAAMQALTLLKRIDFYTNNIRGSIPSQLGLLEHLTRLDLYDNDLTGSIPKELGNLLQLEKIRLFENALTGSLPEELGNCSNLEELTVGNNSIFGSIPSQIGALTKLFSLDLSNNRLTGSLPNTFSNLRRLANFFVSHNRLTGSIPASAIRRMTSLEIIKLRENRIEGSLPTELGRLSTIYTIDLAYNDLTGSIPSEIAVLPWLHGLDLRGNKLSGPLPTELVDMDSLTDIDVRANELTGDVPRLPTYLTNCKLDGNRFSDTSNADGICRT